MTSNQGLGGAKPTLATIAQATGVSIQTVSNVINGKIGKVAPATREKVQKEIEHQGYRPNRAARLLRTRRSALLGYRLRPTTDGIHESVLDRLLHSLTDSAKERGYELIVFTAPSDQGEIEAYRRLREEHNVDGFLLTSTNFGDPRANWLLDHGIPFVTFGRPWGEEHPEKSRHHDWVDVAGKSGCEDATRMLLARGCTRIAFIGWPHGSGAGDDRRNGWECALAEAMIPERLARHVEDTVTDGYYAAQQLLAEGADAFVCVSDSLALGALGATKEREPRYSANIVGFDNTPVAVAVGLSSVSQSIEEAASIMIELLIGTIEGDHSARDRLAGTILPAVLHTRHSATLREWLSSRPDTQPF